MFPHHSTLQVRLAASVATRQFLQTLPSDLARDRFFPILAPRMCLNRWGFHKKSLKKNKIWDWKIVWEIENSVTFLTPFGVFHSKTIICFTVLTLWFSKLAIQTFLCCWHVDYVLAERGKPRLTGTVLTLLWISCHILSLINRVFKLKKSSRRKL